MPIELAFHDKEAATTVAQLLMDNGYAVMLTTEENLTILSAVQTGVYANRNLVMFMHIEEFDELYERRDYDDDLS